MKTKDFIKMLQEEDPSGEAHIRMAGGVPVSAEGKAGYYDGPYSFIDEHGNWNYSNEGGKVDIQCTDVSDFVYDLVDIYDTPTWDDVKNKFKFSLGGYAIKEHQDERITRFLKEAKESYDSAVEMYEKFKVEGIERAIKMESEGYKWFQNKLVDDDSLRPNLHHYYTWKIFDGGNKEDSHSNPHYVEAVYKSGLFERLDNNKMPGYYEWVKKP